MRMPKRLKTPGGTFGYSLIDVRTLDSDGLLESPHFGDNVIAVLTRLRDEREAIRRMIEKSTALPRSECAMAMHALPTLAGLRGLEAVVCQLRHKVAARESITWPALRQNPFNLNSAVPSPTVSSEA
jgi:hypothetical protein